MTKTEKNSIIEQASQMTDAELESEYYDSVLNSLGSITEEIYERGYDMSDIKEREQYEKFLSEKSGVLETLCEERGIVLWDGNCASMASDCETEEGLEK